MKRNSKKSVSAKEMAGINVVMVVPNISILKRHLTYPIHENTGDKVLKVPVMFLQKPSTG